MSNLFKIPLPSDFGVDPELGNILTTSKWVKT